MKTFAIVILFITTSLFGSDDPKDNSPQTPPASIAHGCWTDRVANDSDTGALVAEFLLDDGKTLWLTIPADYSFDPKCFDLVEQN